MGLWAYGIPIIAGFERAIIVTIKQLYKTGAVV